MAEATILSLLNRLAPLMENKVREEVCLLSNANNEARNLFSKLKKIQEVLMDAERKGVADPMVKSWLEKLQDIAYEIDDMLDIWEIENIRQQVEESDDASESSHPWEKDFERSQGHIITCKMHDIVHDYAQFLTKNESLIVERVDEGRERVSSQNVRHLNLLQDEHTAAMSLVSICQTEKLHSFFCTNSIPLNLFSHLKRVRSLRLQGCNLEDIPQEIGRLIHMRYLGLIQNPIRELPKTICGLYYLETLDISHCEFLSGLPEGIHNLMKLRHLPNLSTSHSFEFPQGFEKLTNLRTLHQFSVEPGRNELGCLKDLNQLRVYFDLSISHFDGAYKLEAEKVDLKSKKHIRELTLLFVDTEPEIVEALQPHPNLEILDFNGKYLPKWITTLTNLRALRIIGSTSSSLPPLGKLPFLEELYINKAMEMEHLGHEFLGINKTAPLTSAAAFPKLKRLEFSKFLGWKEWEDISEEVENSNIISILPCLQELVFIRCRKLKALPHRILRKASSLQTLTIFVCNHLEHRYNPSGEDRDKVSHIPNVQFDL